MEENPIRGFESMFMAGCYDCKCIYEYTIPENAVLCRDIGISMMRR
jgi:hypothetical protein